MARSREANEVTMDDRLSSPLHHHAISAAELKLRQADKRFIDKHMAEDCVLCTSGPYFPFSTAFQPIVDVQAGIIVACEALAREPKGEPASSVVDKTLHNNRYATDQRCRGKAALGYLCGLGQADHPRGLLMFKHLQPTLELTIQVHRFTRLAKRMRDVYAP